ncbi:MAG: minor extracellular serine protease Vpr, partial [Actinomycetota bacterium]
MDAVFAPDSNGRKEMTGPLVGNYVNAGLADIPNQIPDSVRGRICLAQRGSTAVATGHIAAKAIHCAQKGAIATVVFNNVPGPLGLPFSPSPIPLVTISLEDGLLLRDTYGFDAAGISKLPIRLTPPALENFVPRIADFSSRGPVAGFGQVKPDVVAPGEEVLAASNAVGALDRWTSATSLVLDLKYYANRGTSMSAPHVSGAAALIRQAHRDWTPDMVRTALINYATNLRQANGTPIADGATSIIDQGGGLIDVAAAVNASALMGVIGDGIAKPQFLGSHSFGAEPIGASAPVSSRAVTVTVRDLSGGGGLYNLRVVNNRGTGVAGVTVSVTPSVVVPAGGAAPATVTLQFDPAAVAAFTKPIDVQWYLVAERADGQSLMRMPFYWRAVPA